MKDLGLWSPGLRNIFLKICKTLRPSSYILNVRSLINLNVLILLPIFLVAHLRYHTPARPDPRQGHSYKNSRPVKKIRS